MNIRCVLLSAVLVLGGMSLGAALPATAQDIGAGEVIAAPAAAEPNACVSDFFKALEAKRYADCWNLLSETSQEQIVRMIATEIEVDNANKGADSTKPQVDFLNERVLREVFASGNNSITSAFWSGLEQKLDSRKLMAAPWLVVFNNGIKARVAISENEARYCVVLKENGQWRFGLFESYLDAENSK